MEIEIGGVTYRALYSIRAYMLFESATGRTFTGGTLSDEVWLLLSAIWAGSSGCTVTLDELTAALDERPELLARWRAFLTERIEAQNARMSGGGTTSGKKKASRTPRSTKD